MARAAGQEEKQEITIVDGCGSELDDEEDDKTMSICQPGEVLAYDWKDKAT